MSFAESSQNLFWLSCAIVLVVVAIDIALDVFDR